MAIDNLKEAHDDLWRIARSELIRRRALHRSMVANLTNQLHAAQSDLTDCNKELAAFDAKHPI